MIEVFIGQSPVVQAFLAGCFTWGITALGASAVYLTRTASQRMLSASMGFAAGVMIAASFWSLILPAIELAGATGAVPLVPAAAGFALGWVFLLGLHLLLPHLHLGFACERLDGPKSSLRRTTLLILAVTLHNIPEGLAIGVAFGAVAAGIPSAAVTTAIALSIGIGIQNFPEGLAISVPLREEGMSRLRGFWYGQLSAAVEPVAAVAGAAAVLLVRPVLPYALAFAAGAMIFVVIEEVVPGSLADGHEVTSTLGFLAGFLVMMVLDVGLG